MTDYEFKCGICGRLEIRPDLEEFSCLCQQKPIGLKYYHHCLECNNYYWGSSQADCTQCTANKLSKTVSFEPFGDLVNVKRRDPEQEQQSSDLAYERILQARKEVQDLKALEQRSNIETAKLLKELNIKLDSILERREFEC